MKKITLLSLSFALSLSLAIAISKTPKLIFNKLYSEQSAVVCTFYEISQDAQTGVMPEEFVKFGVTYDSFQGAWYVDSDDINVGVIIDGSSIAYMHPQNMIETNLENKRIPAMYGRMYKVIRNSKGAIKQFDKVTDCDAIWEKINS